MEEVDAHSVFSWIRYLCVKQDQRGSLYVSINYKARGVYCIARVEYRLYYTIVELCIARGV